MIISMIAAMDRNRLIGNNNQLPWHLPADLQHFKQITMGKPILMGRKTYDSIGHPLPGRMNIVLSRSKGLKLAGIEVVNSLSQAKSLLTAAEELMIIGGSSIYRLLLDDVDRIYLTEVDAVFEGDSWFPALDSGQWQEIEVSERHADEKNLYACRFITLQRNLA